MADFFEPQCIEVSILPLFTEIVLITILVYTHKVISKTDEKESMVMI